MRLMRFDAGSGSELGLAGDNGVIAIKKHAPNLPSDMIELIADWSKHRAALQAIENKAPDYQLSAVKILAPIARPGKLLGIGLNYADHQAESGLEKPKDQLWFMMPATAVNGPFDPIRMPRVSDQLDYEVEMVIVIGKQCRYASPEEAAEAIFGYSVGNDVSIRDWQFRTSQFILGKSFDGHAPFGPWIVTADSIDAANQTVRCVVNGEERQSSNTKYMIFDPAAQVAHLSQVMTLEPGDILFSGTPGGVGAAMKPPAWLKPGDVLRSEIGDIGAIEARVVAD